ncbi:capsule biosynthesis protein [Ruegeria pomeroyi]|uniref:Capsule biosynthesis protein n=1 Tax=Ruegeria alba TaxID=2916756 RepID=A0ABS9NW03_9RHOB|nr:capsule biosynthesis protein [Ruegeria alba]MCE8512981.1 capsule biosynthesis protein [Ruegeria pomeroyi]MCE8521901.1 capsule biosynthesis protein [Ruegeria pomeroyi]MCE8526284.1 capsule biosynthesis protein [Ruegeria pomeroyi]MCE8529555.1 capsule biosynthesis protein [Ruegeria pomeroyi]MCE8547223.1 capsule biosynthesis protein [Ruegeria pomeroyi]
MTTKPKAKKFRIRRTGAPLGGEGASAAPARPQPAANVSPLRPQPDPTHSKTPQPGNTPVRPQRPAQGAAPTTSKALEGQVSSATETTAESEIDAIKREGLTGRQLRMARRLAQKHNLPVTSDYEAVRQLRARGIDPLERGNMLDLVVQRGKDVPPHPDADNAEQEVPKIQLPQTVQPRQMLPSTELSPTQRREMEIGRIQQDIMRRRRRKMLQLLTRLAFFVFLPTLIAGYYFYAVATPMYASKSEFVILQADGSLGGVGGFFAGTQFATSQDSISVQSFLESKEAMLLLDRDQNFKAHFQQAEIDPIQRLAPDASNEEAYKVYSRIVTIGYDPTEGVIRMEVAAPDPQVATDFSKSLLSYAESRVNNLSGQKREDQMREARKSFEDAQSERRKAQEALVELQQQGALLDPESVIASLRGRIDQVEVQLQEKELQLAALLDNARPSKAKVDGARADIARLNDVLDDLNARMLDTSSGENSLARLSVRIQMAQADLASRDMMLQGALQQMETTRMEANRQVRYLTVSVNPVPSDEPSYPRSFENTILAFLLFAGIYLMISLTASILREQVSS